MRKYVVELYRGTSPDAIGTPLEDWDGQLDAETLAWLDEQGWGADAPDLWVLISRVGEWAPTARNKPIATRTITTG